MQFRTERLTIRTMTMDDLEASYQHRSCPETSRYIGVPITRAQAQQRLRESCKPWEAEENEKLGLAITLSKNDQFIGELMFKYVNKDSLVGEIGYRLY